ncbi:mitochondrial genome maintenance exonuclease 1-like [Prorops nasuta]|uniref:mitochondrial genome maintenance exonuclease 1-like n=1 Tax=Prorops nasuta TaxID=863751 RepID=UPI0034CD264D
MNIVKTKALNKTHFLKLEVMLGINYTNLIFCKRYFFLLQNLRWVHLIKKDRILWNNWKETRIRRALFGKLLKTKKKKLLEEKQNAKLSKPITIINYNKLSTNSIHYKNKDISCNDKSLNTAGTANICKDKADEKKISTQKSLDQSRNSNKSDLANMLKNNAKLASIIVKNLETFPLLGRVDKPIVKDHENSNIISISYDNFKECTNFPSVSKILQQTMSSQSKLALERWKSGMIKKLGLQGFEDYMKETLDKGIQLHSCIEKTLLQKEFEVSENIGLLYKSVKGVLSEINSVKALESHVVHPEIYYRGQLDCIAFYRGKLCLIEWKTSKKRRNNLGSTYDNPIQIASYIGAVNSSTCYPFKVTNGLIVIAYGSGEPATVHELNNNQLQNYWQQWLMKLQMYFKLFL